MKLIDIIEIIGGGTPKTSCAEYWNGDIPWLSVKDFNNDNRYVYSTEKTITQSGLKHSSTKLLQKDDIIISARGTVGEMAMIPFPMTFNQSCYGIRGKNNVDKTFLYYFLKNSIHKLKALTHGSVFDTITRNTFEQIEIDLPDLESQKKISSVLSALDDKIELNNRINKNLEEQAQAIFVDYMNNNRYNLIPLDRIADIIDCLHSKKPVSVTESNYQLIQLNNIRDDGFLDMTACRYMISKKDYENWTRKCEIVEGDCVITNVGRIGAVSQAPAGTKGAMGRNMTCIRLKNEFNLSAYLITALLSEHMKTQITLNTDEGTIMGALNVKNIPKLLFPIYTSEIMRKLEKMLLPIRKQIENNNLQNQRLSALRDALLPELMNGRIDVSEIKI